MYHVGGKPVTVSNGTAYGTNGQIIGTVRNGNVVLNNGQLAK